MTPDPFRVFRNVEYSDGKQFSTVWIISPIGEIIEEGVVLSIKVAKEFIREQNAEVRRAYDEICKRRDKALKKK